MQADPMDGKWKLNLAESRYSPGPAPKSMNWSVSTAAESRSVSAQGVTSQGDALSFQWTANFDGKDYPMTGYKAADTVSIKRIDSSTTETITKKAGKVVATINTSVSSDGRVLTSTMKGTNLAGAVANDVLVFDKQ